MVPEAKMRIRGSETSRRKRHPRGRMSPLRGTVEAPGQRVRKPQGSPRTNMSGVQIPFHNDAKTWFAFFTYSLTSVQRNFPETTWCVILQPTECRHRYADPAVFRGVRHERDLQRYIKQCYSSQFVCLLENIAIEIYVCYLQERVTFVIAI